MIKKDGKFNEQVPVFRFMAEEFAKIPTARLIDIIPAIDIRNKNDMPILAKWQKHFEAIGVPYTITSSVAHQKDRRVTYYALWKERRI